MATRPEVRQRYRVATSSYEAVEFYRIPFFCIISGARAVSLLRSIANVYICTFTAQIFVVVTIDINSINVSLLVKLYT